MNEVVVNEVAVNELARVIGNVVGWLAQSRLRSGGVGSMLRIRDFGRDQIVEIASRLRGFDYGGTASPISVVVGSHEGWPGLDPALLLPPDKSATTLRNETLKGELSGYVLLEDAAYTDAQGLSRVACIDDQSVLRGLEDAAQTRRRIVSAAWEVVGGSEELLPRALHDFTEELYQHRQDIALRRWVDFVLACVRPLARSGRAQDARTVGQAIGAALPLLGLFADTTLYDRQDSERAARLLVNANCSDRLDPKGKAIDADELAARAGETPFVGLDGAQLEGTTLGSVRQQIRGILFPTGRVARNLELSLWLQLFPDGAPSRGLGRRIRDHLEEVRSEHLDVFDQLNIEDRLDSGDQAAAQRLLEDGEKIVVAALPRQLRRAVERLAEPRRSSVDDPLRWLFREIYAVVQDLPLAGTVDVGLRRVVMKNADDRRSVRLFSFLFGRTLEALVRDGPGARVALAIDPELVRVEGAGLERAARDEGGGDLETGWSPLVLEVVHHGTVVAPRRVEWRPLEQTGMIALAAIVDSDDEAWLSGHESFEAWCRHGLEVLSAPADDQAVLDGRMLDGGQKVLVEEPVLEEWRNIRVEHLAGLRTTGLSAEALLEYVELWRARVLSVAVDKLAPSGAPLPALSRFLTCDTFRDASGRVTLLATHPLRARWVAHHLRETGRRLQRLLDDGVVLNPVNDGFYFASLAQLSPHEQPPIVTADEKLFVSVREESWHEHYATLRRPDRGDDDWLSELDDASIDELARVVDEYVVAHPHKADGISILLLVRSGGARVLRRLARRAFRSGGAPRRVHLHVYAPREEAGAIERSLAEFDDPEQRSDSNTPFFDVELHVWLDGQVVVPSLTDFRDEVDLALVPNLFGSHTRAQETTRKAAEDIGSRFDPWIDAPTHIDNTSTASAENVSRVLLPRRSDALLEAWSTLSVRGFRHNKVGSDIDYVLLQVRFDRTRELFDELHRVAQWVVTLDAFIGRDQIEALPRQPDVITVRPDIGKSQAYTLVVSSSSGRSFVVDRLQHRLEADLPEPLRLRARAVAERLYESSRFLAPGILLRALGLGWAVQELVGLAIVRRLVDERRPVLPGEGFVAWLSLDEHAHWFGAGRRSRADLARLAFVRRPDGRMRLEVLVVEAKFRDQAAMTTADDQVENTRELLAHALTPQTAADPKFIDLEFWRREILGAVEQLPRGGDHQIRSIWSWNAGGKDAGGAIPTLAREDWIGGDYDLDEVSCIVCTTSPSESVAEPIQRTPGDHVWYRVGREELARIIDAIDHSDARLAAEPGPLARAASAARPAPERVPSVAALPNSQEKSPEPVADAHRADRADTVTGTPARGLSQDQLESRYQRVLDVFGEFRVGVTRPNAEPYREGPGFYVFRLQPAPGVRPDAIRGYADEVKLKLELQADAVPRSYIDRGCVVFEVPKPDHERYFVEAESLWQRTSFDDSRLNAPIGEDIKGDVVEIDFSSDVSPHLLIAGQTGAGKSIALETILLGLTRHRPPSRLRLGLVDPKTTELVAFETSPHLLRPIGWGPEDAVELLEAAVVEMERRRDVFRAERTRALPEYNGRVADRPELVLPWWVIVLDEYADLTSEKNHKKRIEESLQRLSAKARASGIHVIVATQRPSADVISTVVRSNLVAQLALRVRSGVESNIVMAEAGAEALAGKGDAFFKNAQRIVRVQCAKVRNP